MPIARSHRSTRSRRINLRATARQERLIRIGATTRGLSMTEFILDSACVQAEHALADQKKFVASPKQWQVFLRTLDKPGLVLPGLIRLFRRSPA